MSTDEAKPKIHAVILVTLIVYRHEGEYRHNTFQSNVSYDEDTPLEEVRSAVGKSQVRSFLEQNDKGIKLKNIKYVVTTPVAKTILDGYLQHLTGIN
jgi:hypothetical protein